MKKLLHKLRARLQDPESRVAKQTTALLALALCLLLALLVTLLALCIPHGARSASNVPDNWPDDPLFASLPVPATGGVADVTQQTDADGRVTSVAVFLSDVATDDLQPYVKAVGDALGKGFTADAPFVAFADGRTVVIDYDPATRRMSVTVLAAT